MLFIFPVLQTTSGTNSSLEWDIHGLVNKEREQNDLPPLKMHSILIEVARKHSQDMMDRNFFDHENPDGELPSDRVENVDLTYTAVAENIFMAMGYQENEIAELAVDSWIESPGHHQNMLSETSYTGIGVILGIDTYYITQVFVEGKADVYEEGVIDEGSSNVTISPEILGLTIILGFLAVLKILDGRNKK